MTRPPFRRCKQALEEVGARYTQIQAGPQAVNAIAGSGADLVLNGITGSVGLEPSIAALRAGSRWRWPTRNR